MNAKKSLITCYLSTALFLVAFDSVLYFLAFYSDLTLIKDSNSDMNWMPRPDNFTQAIIWCMLHLPTICPLQSIIKIDSILFGTSILVQNLVIAFPISLVVKKYFTNI